MKVVAVTTPLLYDPETGALTPLDGVVVQAGDCIRMEDGSEIPDDVLDAIGWKRAALFPRKVHSIKPQTKKRKRKR